MGGRIVVILVCMLMLTTVAGSLPSTDTTKKQTEKEIEPSNRDYSHDILGEFFTLTTCFPCRYSHRALKNLDAGEYHPMHYVTMVYDKDDGNKEARVRSSELGVTHSPTVWWDGPYKKDQGSSEDIEEDMADYNVSILECGNRNVPDLDLNLDVEWLGAVRNDPADGQTLVPIEQIMTWTSSQMEIDIEVINNDADEYSSRIRVYVNEVNSTFWDDKWGDPYTNCFLDYAMNVFVDIPASSSWDDTVIFDGYEHNTGYGEDYQNITQDNIIVVATVFRNDTDKYADQTTSIRTGYDTDPKRYDIYFDNTTPPTLIQENSTSKKYIPPPGGLNWEETYYWKVDERDQNDVMTYGDILTFTTRGNDPPNEPSMPNPPNESTSIPILVNLSWIGGDPDLDDVTYNVYFGDNPLEELPLLSENQTDPWYKVGDLEFQHYYYWRIIAWDYYGEKTVGDKWQFTTEVNVPPNQAIDPYPNDGDSAVPTDDLILRWNGSDDNYGDTLKYDVYFDDVNPPTTLQAEGIYVNHFELEYDLQPYNEYYWQIDTTDREGEFTPGKVWTFYTGINHRPTCPIVDGPIKFKPNVEKNFTFVSTDEDNHTVRYVVDWDDETPQVETGLFKNGTIVTLSHAWAKTGTYTIKARAYDEHNLSCNDWTEYEIVVTRSKAFNIYLLDVIFARFPKLFTIILQFIER
jgi:hypothetical protein